LQFVIFGSISGALKKEGHPESGRGISSHEMIFKDTPSLESIIKILHRFEIEKNAV